MPIIVTFDMQRPTAQELNRLRSLFERLCWERIGNTAYRYPTLDAQPATEDWFNHVIPALMLLRAFTRHAANTGRGIRRFSIDVQSSTGFNFVTDMGIPPLAGNQITYTQPLPSGRAFGEQNLQTWIESITWPYPAPPPATGTGP